MTAVSLGAQMSGLRLLVGDDDSAATPRTLSIDAAQIGADGTSPLCELLAVSVMAGVYDAGRRHLFVPSSPSAKLSEQPDKVQALVCYCGNNLGANPEYVVLLAPQHGASLLLPREGASNISEVRVLPSPARGEAASASSGLVALASGPDPYAALLDATRILAGATGTPDADIRAYILPLLDSVNRLRFDATLTSTKIPAYGKVTGVKTGGGASVLEQQLHEGILVQAGPGCPAKPLMQAPSLRLCQGMSAPLGLRYSGMSVVYGTATGHVLAVMNTAAALKMAPTSGMRAAAAAGASPVGRASGGADSPSAVSAGVSATTSATPSPTMSRSNSCGGDIVATGASSPLASMPPALSPRLPALALSGRSITAAPIIQVIAAASSPATGSYQRPASSTPTGAPARVVASFALLGVKTGSGRDGAVRCCRIMPASALSAVPADEEAAGTSLTSLGLVVQVEVMCASAGTLLMFVEGAEDGLSMDPCSEDGEGEGEEARPVQRVAIDGKQAGWRYDSTGGILAVELAAAGATREVQVFL